MADEEGVPGELPRPLHVSWHEILPLIDVIEQRLTVIEEHLGITGETDGTSAASAASADDAERNASDGG
jgi:hypothetical protein